MAESKNLEKLKAVYVEWGKSGDKANLGPLVGMMADNFSVASMDESTPGLKFAVDSSTKAASIAYLTGIFDHWTMEYFLPEKYVEQGNKIAMFGWCKYQHKVTKRSVECRIANLWEFNEDGQFVSLIDIFDSAKAAAVAMAPINQEMAAS
jgi:uncharacterized protein